MMSYILNILITILFHPFFRIWLIPNTGLYCKSLDQADLLPAVRSLLYHLYTQIYFLQITNEHFMLFSLFIEFFFLTVIAFLIPSETSHNLCSYPLSTLLS